MKRILFFMMAAVLFMVMAAGCQGDSKKKKKSSDGGMKLNQTYTVDAGDQVVKITDDARLSIHRNSAEETIEVTLVQGKAKIVKAK